MKKKGNNSFRKSPLLLACITGLFVLFFSLSLMAQQPPPKPASIISPLSVYADPSQPLAFGAFYQIGTGGTVIVSASGSRTATGNVFLGNLGYIYTPALYQITAPAGSTIAILNGTDVILSGSNGGSITLHIGNSDVGSPFSTTAVPPATTRVHIGGTLTIGSASSNPPGNYSGTFTVTFIQQ